MLGLVTQNLHLHVAFEGLEVYDQPVSGQEDVEETTTEVGAQDVEVVEEIPDFEVDEHTEDSSDNQEDGEDDLETVDVLGAFAHPVEVVDDDDQATEDADTIHGHGEQLGSVVELEHLRLRVKGGLFVGRQFWGRVVLHQLYLGIRVLGISLLQLLVLVLHSISLNYYPTSPLTPLFPSF